MFVLTYQGFIFVDNFCYAKMNSDIMVVYTGFRDTRLEIPDLPPQDLCFRRQASLSGSLRLFEFQCDSEARRKSIA